MNVGLNLTPVEGVVDQNYTSSWVGVSNVVAAILGTIGLLGALISGVLFFVALGSQKPTYSTYSVAPPPALTAASAGAMFGASLSALALATLIANVAACRMLLTQLVVLQARRDGLQPVEEAKEE